MLLWFQKSVSETPQIQSWQVRLKSLSPEERTGYSQLRKTTDEAELLFPHSQTWKTHEPFLVKQLSQTINYVGVVNGTRWMAVVLLPTDKNEKPPAQDDDEHHTLTNGMPIHVTYWKQPATETHSENVVGFPASEGFLQVLR
jgi:hypothetical protein